MPKHWRCRRWRWRPAHRTGPDGHPRCRAGGCRRLACRDCGRGCRLSAVAGGAVNGLIGALTDSGVPEDDAHLYAEGVRRGGSLVTAKVDDARAPEAQAILQGSNWVDPIERRRAYNEQGWTRFDETLDPYAPEQIAQERDRYRRTAI